MGISQVPEGRGIFPGMTVLENLEMGKYFRKDRKNEMEGDLKNVFHLFPRLKEREHQAGGTRPGFLDQRLVRAAPRPHRLVRAPRMAAAAAPAGDAGRGAPRR